MAYAAPVAYELDIDAIADLNQAYGDLEVGDTVIAALRAPGKIDHIAAINDEGSRRSYRLKSGGAWLDRYDVLLVALGRQPIPVVASTPAPRRAAACEPVFI